MSLIKPPAPPAVRALTALENAQRFLDVALALVEQATEEERGILAEASLTAVTTVHLIDSKARAAHFRRLGRKLVVSTPRHLNPPPTSTEDAIASEVVAVEAGKKTPAQALTSIRLMLGGG